MLCCAHWAVLTLASPSTAHPPTHAPFPRVHAPRPAHSFLVLANACPFECCGGSGLLSGPPMPLSAFGSFAGHSTEHNTDQIKSCLWGRRGQAERRFPERAQVMAHPWIKAGEKPAGGRANLLATTSKMRNSMRVRSKVERPPPELLEEVAEVGAVPVCELVCRPRLSSVFLARLTFRGRMGCKLLRGGQVWGAQGRERSQLL